MNVVENRESHQTINGKIKKNFQQLVRFNIKQKRLIGLNYVNNKKIRNVGAFSIKIKIKKNSMC
jgi:hypothetical protein